MRMTRHENSRKPKLLLAATLAAMFVGFATSSAHAAPSSTKSDEASLKAASVASGTVNLNAATEDELMLLPGVGPSKAAAILTWRKKYGSFKKIEDLSKVKGFGRKTLLKLKPHLAVSGPTTYQDGKTSKADRESSLGATSP
ncbi:MAG: helix-hairpin-helix domain-containing protein [Deltaproteobacteria bacterium]|nr:helix-hairpin-helix domain-containing protein [Deltaproteobacteria bacterium]